MNGKRQRITTSKRDTARSKIPEEERKRKKREKARLRQRKCREKKKREARDRNTPAANKGSSLLSPSNQNHELPPHTIYPCVTADDDHSLPCPTNNSVPAINDSETMKTTKTMNIITTIEKQMNKNSNKNNRNSCIRNWEQTSLDHDKNKPQVVPAVVPSSPHPCTSSLLDMNTRPIPSVSPPPPCLQETLPKQQHLFRSEAPFSHSSEIRVSRMTELHNHYRRSPTKNNEPDAKMVHRVTPTPSVRSYLTTTKFTKRDDVCVTSGKGNQHPVFAIDALLAIGTRHLPIYNVGRNGTGGYQRITRAAPPQLPPLSDLRKTPLSSSSHCSHFDAGVSQNLCSVRNERIGGRRLPVSSSCIPNVYNPFTLVASQFRSYV